MCWLISVPLICPIGSAMLHFWCPEWGLCDFLIPRSFHLFALFLLTFIYCHNSISAIYLYLFFKYYFIYICISNITLQNKGIIAVVLCQLFLRILQFLLLVLQQTIKLNVEYYSDYSVSVVMLTQLLSVVMLTHFIVLRKPPLYIYIYICSCALFFLFEQFINLLTYTS